jgi:hypothetical protein
MASHPITLTRKELYENVWSQPVKTLAKEYGISDVGLKKICFPPAKPERADQFRPVTPSDTIADGQAGVAGRPR